MEDRVDSSLRALRRILHAADTASRSLARETRMTGPQLMVLRILKESGEATAKTIAQSVGVAQGTATALIDKLENRGFAVRKRGETDRRQIWVQPTEAGLAALDASPDPLQLTFAEKFGKLEDWEQAMLVAALERVAMLMDAKDQDLAPMLHVGELTEGPPGGEG
ncbi:MarR family winged helix-turn-helix transcriptional regulator [Rhodovulum sp. DZ06]|uniref:MarR family winged helix-turn-helix transcriptional regulator n=1 Tax=Rhodovulum sp. DZ06 TaxID=3425126 RepID=UPI003D327AE1